MANRGKAEYDIGTSGWVYKHWRGPFYPVELHDDQRLRFYCDRFSTVELNNSFYHLPEKLTFKHWREAVPKKFLFAVKGSRFIRIKKS